MTIKLQHSVSSVVAVSAPREVVPAEVYAGIDFDALNRRVVEYRSTRRVHGFDAALSQYAGEPLMARVEPS